MLFDAILHRSLVEVVLIGFIAHSQIDCIVKTIHFNRVAIHAVLPDGLLELMNKGDTNERFNFHNDPAHSSFINAKALASLLRE
jgi:hypothetical protein